MGCPGGMSAIRYTRITMHMYARFSGQFFFKKKKKVVMRKKDPCAVFGCNNDRLFSLFARKARVNTERVPAVHPIILLKSNKFNMAAVSVKRSITLLTYSDI